MITFLRSAHFGRIRAFAHRAARQGRDENQTHYFLHVKPQRGRRESLVRQFNSTQILLRAMPLGRRPRRPVSIASPLRKSQLRQWLTGPVAAIRGPP
jgi:hypothetical protein